MNQTYTQHFVHTQTTFDQIFLCKNILWYHLIFWYLPKFDGKDIPLTQNDQF